MHACAASRGEPRRVEQRLGVVAAAGLTRRSVRGCRGPLLLRVRDRLQRLLQVGDAAPVGRASPARRGRCGTTEVRTLVALQRHAGGRLQRGRGTSCCSPGPGLGVAHDHARRLETRGGDALVAVTLGSSRTACRSVPARRGAWRSRARASRASRRGVRERVGGHGRVIDVRPAFVGLHHLQPLLEVGGVAGAGRAVDAFAARSDSITNAQHGEPLQPFWGR